MSANNALNSEIANVERYINELEVELSTAEYERSLVLYRKIIERTNYVTLLYKKKNSLFDQGKTRFKLT